MSVCEWLLCYSVVTLCLDFICAKPENSPAIVSCVFRCHVGHSVLPLVTSSCPYPSTQCGTLNILFVRGDEQEREDAVLQRMQLLIIVANIITVLSS